MTQRIHKAKGLEKDFFILRNKDVQRTDLSYEAVGLLAYLISLPEDWVIYVSTLERKGTGRDRVKKLINELKANGYLHVIQSHDETGKFKTNDYIVYAIPEDNPHWQPSSEKASTVTPLTANQQLQSKDSKKEKKKESANKSQGERNRLFDGVAFLCFNIKADDESQKAALDANSPRIGKIVSFLKKVDSTPEKLWAFKQWYDATVKLSMPNDLAKFSKYYNEFLNGSASQAHKPTPPPVVQVISEEEQTSALDIIAAARQKVVSND